ncbi:MAG: hypothetical protein Q9191_000616 [Dirinaria sp. TL-2023a]
MPAQQVKRYVDKETNKGKAQEIAALDHEIVKAMLNRDLPEAVRIAEAKIPGFYGGGAKRLHVVWMDPGEEFQILEYDDSSR